MAKIIGKADILKRALGELLSPETQAADEFTAYELAGQGGGQSVDSIRSQLTRRLRLGELTCRKVLIDGKWTNAYRFAAR